jgi:hypothetical protein
MHLFGFRVSMVGKRNERRAWSSEKINLVVDRRGRGSVCETLGERLGD